MPTSGELVRTVTRDNSDYLVVPHFLARIRRALALFHPPGSPYHKPRSTTSLPPSNMPAHSTKLEFHADGLELYPFSGSLDCAICHEPLIAPVNTQSHTKAQADKSDSPTPTTKAWPSRTPPTTRTLPSSSQPAATASESTVCASGSTTTRRARRVGGSCFQRPVAWRSSASTAN
ncbi:hypothetical protein BU26DRAFT_323793 [Trematosphaeria pertusa]|uniref:Uncharacterized protein n=1 Tax=Trematosphaeria pertusa TaxID=390896 RepID=A0A6A6ID03_9PLEO|nr:uncharacterized protein BU26DRAFT_323793 [Trematosphaeria pertusa]KAF2247938.1 hypothetical protein BU26DRAFT_323793 [Trematosphaeria pertusa]